MQSLEKARNWLALLVFVGIVALMDYVLLAYLMLHGLESKLYPLQIGGYGLNIPILSLTFVGMVIVAVAAWQNMSGAMPMTALKDMSQLETLRVLRAAGIALFFFSAVLFTPYVIGSSAFWTQMSSLSRAIPQLASPLKGFISSIRPTMDLEALTKFVISQDSAAATLVVCSGLIGFLQRKSKRVR